MLRPQSRELQTERWGGELCFVLTPFAVKGLTNSRSAADRFKVSGQRSDHATLYSLFSCAFSPMAFLLSVTPGQAGPA